MGAVETRHETSANAMVETDGGLPDVTQDGSSEIDRLFEEYFETGYVAEMLGQDAPVAEKAFGRLLADQCCAMDSTRFMRNIFDESISKEIAALDFSIALAETRSGEDKLIAISPSFERAINYPDCEVLGRNCRFLNKGCDMKTWQRIGMTMASRTGAPFTTVLENRKKTGELFMQFLDLRGLIVATNIDTRVDTWFLIGVQADVTELPGVMTGEVPEQLGNQLTEVARRMRMKIIRRLIRCITNWNPLELDIDRGFARQLSEGEVDWKCTAWAPRTRFPLDECGLMLFLSDLSNSSWCSGPREAVLGSRGYDESPRNENENRERKEKKDVYEAKKGDSTSLDDLPAMPCSFLTQTESEELMPVESATPKETTQLQDTTVSGILFNTSCVDAFPFFEALRRRSRLSADVSPLG